MIKIDIPNIQDIANEYLKIIKGLRYNDDVYDRVFSSNIDELILCKPDDFIALVAPYNDKINEFKDGFTKYMIGQYERIIYDKGIGRWLTDKLKVNVCPYCNRQYTFTVNGKKKIRPQLDHFHPKAKYPYFALSFYNLIPACPECNRIKNEDEIEINPYTDHFGDCKFEVSDIIKAIISPDDKVNWKIDFKNRRPKNDRHIEIFALEELYNGHKDYTSEVMFKAIAYNDEYYTVLKKLLGDSGVSESEMHRIIFGNYVAPEDYGKRPLSKLTADILEQLNVKL